MKARRSAKEGLSPPASPFPVSLLAGFPRQDSEFFRKGLRASAGAHAGLLVLAILLGLFAARDPVKILPSIRVDLVALPDIAKKDLVKFSPDDLSELDSKLSEAAKGAKNVLRDARKEAERPNPPPEDTMSFKKEKPSQGARARDLRSAIERMKALEKIENEVGKGQSKPKALAKGNELSKGSSLVGAPGMDTNAYVSKMQSKLRENWNLPIWLSNQNLDAKVVVFLDNAGYVSHALIAKGSGNQHFDDYVLKTVRSAQPFGPPPDEILEAGVTLGFPL